MKKRIILDCALMAYRNSGLYHYCLNLGREMTELLDQSTEAEMAFYVPPAEKQAFTPAPVIVEKSGFWKKFNRVPSNCRVWHAPFQSGRILPDKKQRPGVKVLLTIHDLNALHEGKSPEEQQRSLVRTQSLIDRADAIVCISKFCREDVYRHCDPGNKPVYVIHNGIHQVGVPKLNRHSYRPSRPFLYGLGYVNRKKNYRALLPLLRSDEIELVISGKLDEPDYAGAIREEAERMAVSDRLHLTGPVTEEEKAWYLQNALAFVHPSLAEGFGAPVVEAMQFGKPLFLSNRTSLPEIAGETAFYFEGFEPEHLCSVFEEGMRIYRSNGLAGRIRKRAEAYNWKQKAIEYLEVYRTLF